MTNSPSPLKSAKLKNKQIHRRQIRESLNSICSETLTELIRIKKPGPPALIIGQLMCELLWLFRKTTVSELEFELLE